MNIPQTALKIVIGQLIISYLYGIPKLDLFEHGEEIVQQLFYEEILK